jgi:hypothetical protein
MAGFTIPNTPDAYNQNQAEPDSLDFQVLGNHGNAVVSGCAVTPGPSGATVAVSAGEVIVNGVHYPVSASVSLSLTAYASSPFFDIVVGRLASGTVSLVVLPGTSGANPVYPTITSNDVVLAAVWRPANTTPTTAMIVDKRLLVPTTTNRVSSGSPSSGTGANGETHVNSSWTSDATLAGPLSVKVGGTWYQVARYSSNFTAGTITANLTGNVTGNVSGTAGAVAWANVTGKPTNFVYSDGGTYSLNITGNAATVTNGVYNDGGTYSINITGSAQVGGRLTNSVNVDPLGGNYIGWSNTFNGFTVQGGFRVTSSNFYATGLGSTTSAANVRQLADGRLAYSTSLRELKEDIQDLNNALDIVNSLRPRTFKAKPQATDTEVEQYIRENVPTFGFIVDEVQADAPELLDFIKDNVSGVKPIMWKTNDLIAILTKAVQELSARLEALEAQ